MKTNKNQIGKVCFCVKPVHILFLFLIVVSVVVILLIPQGTRFQGALIQPQTQADEENVGTIVVEYVKDADSVDVLVNSEDITLGKFAFKVGNEPIEITAITLELEGDTNNESFENLFLSDHEDVDFVWLSKTSLLIDLSANSLIVEDHVEIVLKASGLNVDFGSSAAFHFVDAVAIGVETGKTITSLGVNGMPDPVPQINNFK